MIDALGGLGLLPLHPAALFMLGALFIPFLRGHIKSAYMLMLPLAGFLNLLLLSDGVHWSFECLEFELIFGRVDRLSLLFSYIFHLITFLGILYMLQMKSDLEFMAGFVYAGAALGVVFAGDLISFFLFWEMLTIGAVWLIFAKGTEAAYQAGMRYLLVHVAGGLVLLAGIILYIHDFGTPVFSEIGLSSFATYLIFIGFGVNAAWPVLHAWLPDAYPQSTIGGAIFLSALTTKTAVYAFVRGFPGAEPLIWIGAAMTVFPIFYAVIENDLRGVLSYSLINQVGYMLVGVGVGNHLALNGATSHMFCHILYKSLLFMSIGAVMLRTGKSKATELGGLYKSMPLTCLFCIIGALSISGFPLTSGFISKSMVISAVGEKHLVWIWFMLLFASAGVVKHAGIKIPFFAFFSHDAGHRVKEAPLNMLLAMGVAAILCIVLGVWPEHTLYRLLPYAEEALAYEPYTGHHVIAQLQLLVFASLAFTMMLLGGIYPAEIRCINLDCDWFYRRGATVFYRAMDRGLNALNTVGGRYFFSKIPLGLTRSITEGPFAVIALSILPIGLCLAAAIIFFCCFFFLF